MPTQTIATGCWPALEAGAGWLVLAEAEEDAILDALTTGETLFGAETLRE